MIIDSKNTYTLPLFPLNTVLYPTNKLPLRIFEPRYVDLVSVCMRDNSPFGVIAISSGHETGKPADIFDFGTCAQIIDFDQGNDGLLNIVIVGSERFQVISTSVREDNLLIGEVTDLPPAIDGAIPAEFDSLKDLLREIALHTNADGQAVPIPNSTAELAYSLAQYLPMPLDRKVDLLTTNDTAALLDRLARTIATLRDE